MGGRHRRGRQQGFTLLEMVVAIGIFAVIAAICYGSLLRFLDTREALADKHAELREVQTLFTMLERDVRYMVPRTVRDGFGDPEAALLVSPDNPPAPGEILRLSVGEPDPASPAWHAVKRVAWRVEDGEVVRVTWRVLDRDQDSTERRRRVYQEVSDISVRPLTWSDEQGLREASEWGEPEELPVGVEITVSTVAGRTYRRVLETSNGT